MIHSLYQFTNKRNHSVYFGKTRRDPEVRKSEHIKDSQKPYGHKNRYAIHDAISKYGIGCFNFEVIHQSDDPILINDLERRYIAKFKALGRGVYNETEGGDGGSVTPEIAKKISEKMTGVKKTREHVSAQVESKSRQWIVMYPSKEWKIIKNLSQFCREHGIRQGNMIEVAGGRMNFCKGFRCARYTGKESEITEFVNRVFKTKNEKHSSYWLVTFPDGTEETIMNMTQFCRERGLSQGCMTRVSQGFKPSHKGFRCTKLS